MEGVERRTVEISAPSYRPRTARRARRRPAARGGPDRLALWAVVLGLFLAIVAATTARGDEEPGSATATPAAETRR